jgi:hypothetical protein
MSIVPPQGFDIAAHDIHADAAARELVTVAAVENPGARISR